MTVLSGQTIRKWFKRPAFHEGLTIIHPWAEETKHLGMSYGLSVCGYDIRIGAIDRKNYLNPDHPMEQYTATPGTFLLLSSLEFIHLPNNIVGVVHDKSTLARRGLALQNTVLEPGWFGHITLELSNHGAENVRLEVGMPIAQVLFHYLDEPAENPYTGKYQGQEAKPVHAIYEASDG